MADDPGWVQLKIRVEADQHERLRTVAFTERGSIADIVREGIDLALAKRALPRPAALVGAGGITVAGGTGVPPSGNGTAAPPVPAPSPVPPLVEPAGPVREPFEETP